MVTGVARFQLNVHVAYGLSGSRAIIDAYVVPGRTELRLKFRRPSHALDDTHHSITRDAPTSNDRGTSSPSARAVFRLITKSNSVGCITGRSPGFAPFSTLST